MRLGITDWLPGYTPPEPKPLVTPEFAERLAHSETTIAEIFRAEGYRTINIGKWHLGPTPADWPEAHGYDVNIAGIESGGPPGKSAMGAYFSPYDNPRLTDGPVGEFLTERLADESIAAIRASQGRPFFLLHSFFQVHSPLAPAPAFIARYRAKAAALGESPPKVELKPGQHDRARQDNPVYGSMVSAFDAALGRVLDELDRLKIADNTIVVLTSDNGGWSWITDRGRSATANLPLRGGKGWLYEGGIRVPLVIRAPGIASGRSAVRATTIDLVPTVLDLAGIGRPRRAMDGLSLVSTLRGGKAPERDLHWHYPHYHNFGSAPHGAIRSGDWKLIEFFETGRVELYDLAADPGESRDLSAARPTVAERMRRRLAAWRARVGAKLPVRRLAASPRAE